MDALPDELVVAILEVVTDARALANLGLTCTHLYALTDDQALWQRLFERRYGAPVHERAVTLGLGWKWLYWAHTPATKQRTKRGAKRIYRRNRVGMLDTGDRRRDGKLIGRTYRGQLLGRTPHGYGHATWVVSGNIITYEGDWRNGMVHGKGVIVRRGILATRGSRYEGHMRNGKYHGQGTMRFAWGTYEGQWSNGVIQGCGVMRHKDGDVTEGQWKKGRAHGHCVRTHKSGSRYEGQMRHGVRRGRGTFVAIDGTTFKGQWVSGCPHGSGVLTFASGSRYVGQMQGGKPHGEGTLYHISGDVVRGRWEYGMVRGRHTSVFANGDRYKGWKRYPWAMVEGTMRYADGRTYTGQWKGDRPCGRGLLKDVQGRVLFRGRVDASLFKPHEHANYSDTMLPLCVWTR